MERQNKYNAQDEIMRWNRYSRANNEFPQVRRNEIREMLVRASPKPGNKIIEVGIGNGILTYELAKAISPSGAVYAFDYRKENLNEAMARNSEALPIIFAPQINNPQTGSYSFPLSDGSVDTVTSLAALHHYDDRSLKTEITGRRKAFKEFARVLKKGGRLIIGDILDDTPLQRYFDEGMDNPKSPVYCVPRGHPHDFVNKELVNTLCKESGLSLLEFTAINTSLEFNTEKDAGIFLNTVHNAKCSYAESLNHAESFLGSFKKDGKFYINWPSFFMVAEK